ncbi:MAG: response regulator transcription factor [Verrucomicrobia bacterium]|nr:response regulator transcription factor [Verrucomicrobiota bacterium]
MKTSVAIVEDDSRFRVSLCRLIGTFSDCECVASFANTGDALAGLPEVAPAVVLMDIHLPDFSGIECVARLKPLMPATEFVMLTAYEDSDNVFKALSAGASGYLLKQAGLEEIHAAVLQVASGGAPMSAHIARKVVQAFRPSVAQSPPPPASLTAREAEILGLLAQGLLYKEIADRVSISYATVNNHVRHIYEKLHVNSRSQAVAKWLGSGGAAPD